MAIPDRWIPYTACGDVIEGTQIVCFKVPLRTVQMKSNKEITELWNIEALLEKVPRLTAVIDLTNTKRYYDPEDLRSAGVAYHKIFIPGRIIPPESKVNEFKRIIETELDSAVSGSIIGVHCTHGLNRTGYMVCRYMRDCLNIAPQEAIERFEKARGYKIERENYLADILGKNPPPPDVGPGVVTNIVSTNAHNWRTDYRGPQYSRYRNNSQSDNKKKKRNDSFDYRLDY